MRRPMVFTLAVSLVAVLALLHAGPALHGGAQSATPAPMAGHPLVGSWSINDPTNQPSVTSFTADGVVIDAETGGGIGLGTWQATGPRTASFTFVIQTTDPSRHFTGTVVVRATVEVAAAGETLTSDYSYTVVALNGTVVDKGMGKVTGTRVPVEPVGAVGTPLAGYPTVVATPVAGTPSA